MAQKSLRNMTTSVIICTRNRADDLVRCLESIAFQTLLPDEVLIVDGSDDNQLSALLKNPRFDALFIQYIHTEPGLTRQRNKGIIASNGDVVFFFDDDVKLDKEYIEKSVNVYKKNGLGNIGGVQGIDLNIRETFLEGRRRLFFHRLFFLKRNDKFAKLLPSGFCVRLDVASPKIRYSKVPIRISCISGCIMSFHKKVFKYFRFDERYCGYSHGEDAEFSYRVSQKYNLYFTSFAKAFHNQPPEKKRWYKTESYVKSSIKAQVYLFRKHLRKGFLNYFAILWSWLGLVIWDGFIHPNRIYFWGNLKAMRDEFLNIFKPIN